VLDGANRNRELSVRNQAERRKPHYYPPGCRVTGPIAGLWDSTCNGGGYAVLYIQVRPGEPETELGGTRTVIGRRTVHHQPASLVLWSTPPKIDPSTGKPYTDPGTGKPYEADRIIGLVWTEAGYRFSVVVHPDDGGHPYHQDDLVHVAQQIADSVG
jgi:hypothetical protein